MTRGPRILAALEIKASTVIAPAQLHGLRTFLEHHPRVPAFVLAVAERERLLEDKVLVVPWEQFVTRVLNTF